MFKDKAKTATAEAFAGPGATGAVIDMGTVTLTYEDQRNVLILFTNAAPVPKGGYLKVTIDSVQNPGCTAPITGF